MPELNLLGKLLIIAGFVLILFGLIISFSQKIPFLGKLPGDILIQKKSFTFYFPIATSILVSLVLSIILWLFSRR